MLGTLTTSAISHRQPALNAPNSSPAATTPPAQTLLKLNPSDDCPKLWRCIMKALITALALITLIAAPSFAGPAEVYHASPSSPEFSGNGN
jgi:hypothetical protein